MRDAEEGWGVNPEEERRRGSKENATLLSITVRLRTRDGAERVVEIDPKDSDALFWTLGAVERFLLPFYCATKGFDFAEDVHSKLVDEAGIIRVPIVHKKLCKPVWLDFDRGDPGPFLMP